MRSTDRPQLAKAIAGLAEGDCLAVCKLDSLARSTRESAQHTAQPRGALALTCQNRGPGIGLRGYDRIEIRRAGARREDGNSLAPALTMTRGVPVSWLW